MSFIISPPASTGGVTTYSNVNVATTYTLTSGSTGYLLEIDAQAWNIKVVLPNATTMNPNQNAFSIRNIGAYPIVIEDFTGNSIGGVPPATQIPIGVNDTTTSSGSWSLNQDSCFSTEVSQIKTSFYSHTFTVRLSNTKFAIIGTNAGTTGYSIQGFTLNGDVITSGTLTNVRTAAATFIEAKAIDANRVIILYFSGTSIFGIIADLTNIASPTIGTETTITTNFVNDINLIFKFDVKPINDIGYYESNLTYSGRLTGTNTFALLYGSNTAGRIALIGYLCGSSGTTITVTNEVINNSPFNSNAYLHMGAISISSSSVGFCTIYNFNSSGVCRAYTYSLSGTTWSGNSYEVLNPNTNMINTLGMVASNTLIYVNTRGGTGFANQGLFAIQFPSSGNAAPAAYQAAPLYKTDGVSLLLTANGAIVCYNTNAAIEGFTYVANTSLTSTAYSTGLSLSISTGSVGYIDTTTCSTFELASTNYRFMVNFSGSAITAKNLNGNSESIGLFYGFAGSTNKFILLMQRLTNTLYQKIVRGTFDTSLNWTVDKNLGWSKYSAYQQGFSIRYCYQLAKYLINFNSYNQIVVPMSLTSKNGFLGNSGFRDYQISGSNLTSTTNAAQDIDSQRVVWVQTQSGIDSSTSDLPQASSGTNVRFSLLRIANT
jgi:hypothetical protein